MNLKGRGAVLALIVLIVPALRAEITLPTIFGDHMVLQQGIPLPVWGTAAPGEKITVSVDGQTGQATADAKGKWTVRLNSLPVSRSPVEMTVTGSTTRIFKDVLVGDVWLCSGQSNMEFGITKAVNAAAVIPKVTNPQIRLFLFERTLAFDPQENCKGEWVLCNPENLQKGGWGGFSAVAYFFGRDLAADRKVPMGLIESSWGGSPAEAWTSLEKLQSVPALASYARNFLQLKANLADLVLKYKTVALVKWQSRRAAWEAKPAPRGKPPVKPTPPDDDHRTPTTLFNGMIAPLLHYGLKGVIWYQGEANANSEATAKEYATLLPALIEDWRQRWGQQDLPFLFVQLPGYDGRLFWPYLRESQRKTLSLPQTAMAVTLDVGEAENLHPLNKEPVGHRLALAARGLAYGEDIVYSGPIYKSMKVENGKIVVSFDHVGSGLRAGPMTKVADAPLEGFEIAGADQKFVPAKAMIQGDTVVVWSDQVSAPQEARYAWAPFPSPPANLYNKEGLLASPFSTAEVR